MSFKSRYHIPYLGAGLGLRPVHYEDLLQPDTGVEWLEVISENYMLDGAQSVRRLDPYLERYPVIPHGVSLSLGSVDSLDKSYLKTLKRTIKYINPPWFSDHLCWAGYGGAHLHNLLPLPYTRSVAAYVADKIRYVQDEVGKPFLIENVSSYVEYVDSQMPEWEFLSMIADMADCGLLLDVNNVYVSARNHHFDPLTYIKSLPIDRVVQYHIAGHLDKGTFVLDTHDHPVRTEVWDLFAQTVPLFGEVSMMIERDDNIPPFSELKAELDYAKEVYANAQTIIKQTA